jgi:hypothetical protein
MVEVLIYQDKFNDEFQILLNGVMQLPVGFPMPWEHGEYNLVQGHLEPISAFFAYSKSIPDKTFLDQQVLDEMYRLAVLKTQKSFMPPIANYSANILTKSMLHFLQEEQVLFPEIIKLKVSYKLKVRELLKQHVEIKKVYSAIVEAIELEDHKALLQWAKQAVAILRKHIKVEDKFFNAVQQKGITPTVARQINLKLEEYNRAVG